MADPATKPALPPAKKCPGWPHDYYHPHHPAVQARESRGDVDPICDFDREQFLDESMSKETTIAEREQQRARLHAAG